MKPRKLSIHQKIVQSHLKPELKINWPREVKIAKELYALYPDDGFWESYTLDFKLNSLAWFKMDAGTSRLMTDYMKFKMEIPKLNCYKLEKEKVGEDVKIEFKPKTLVEFLNFEK